MSSSMPAVARDTGSLLAVFSTASLLRIFFYFVDAVHIPFRTTDPRTVLSLVCKRWANIIRSSPCLWDTFRFEAPSTSMDYSENDALRQFASLCMERCGQNSLNIDTVCGGWTFSIVDSLIIPYMDRIRSLRCLISGDMDTIQFFTMEGQFSALKSIEIFFHNKDSTALTSLHLDILPHHASALRTAPQLTNATMHLINGLNPLSLPVPWDQLTTLNLGTVSMSPDACIEILDSTYERLADAFFYIEFTELSSPHHILWKHKVTMHALTTLRLRFLFPSADTRLFSLLRFPSLQNLWVQMHDVFQDWNLSLYTKLLQASTQLRQLFLCDFYSPGFGMMPEESHTDNAFVAQYRRGATTYHPLERLLKVIRNVEELHLPVGLYVDEHTVEAIASCALLPRLHSLDLGINDGWKIIFMARRRRGRAVNIPLILPGPSHPSQTTAFRRRHVCVHPPPPTRIHFIHMLVPRDGRTEDQKRALIEAAQGLAFLDITCCVQTTQMLPLLRIK